MSVAQRAAKIGFAYEMGFMHARGLQIAAWSTDGRSFLDHVAAFRRGGFAVFRTEEHRD